MPLSTYSEAEFSNFLTAVLDSELAVAIFNQLRVDGGNTVFGLVDSLQAKGMKASKTRVYEEISLLLSRGLIKRISKRPPIYTINIARENLEELASKFFMDTREELMRRWAATYPFLPAFLKESQDSTTSLSSIPMVDFNPYPIVDIFQTDAEGLRRYFERMFESNTILISNTIINTLASADNVRLLYEKENFKTLFSIMKKNFERNDKITLKVLSTMRSKDTLMLEKVDKLPPFYQPYFKLIEYELREPTQNLSSFIIGDNKVLIPIGMGGSSPETYFIIEIRDTKIVKKALSIFNKAWASANRILKISNGELVSENSEE